MTHSVVFDDFGKGSNCCGMIGGWESRQLAKLQTPTTHLVAEFVLSAGCVLLVTGAEIPMGRFNFRL